MATQIQRILMYWNIFMLAFRRCYFLSFHLNDGCDCHSVSFHFVLLYKSSNWDTKPKTTQLYMQISQQALYVSTLPNQNYTFIHPPPPACLLHHFALICLPHISKSLFIGIYRGFYHFSYKRTGSISPPFCNVAHLWQRIGAISDLSTFLS